MDTAAMASVELVRRLAVSRRWVAGVLAIAALLGVAVGVFLLVSRDRADDVSGNVVEDAVDDVLGGDTESIGLPDGAELLDIDSDGEDDFMVYNGELVDIRPDTTVSTAWIAGISAIVSAILTGGISLVVALLGRHDKQALEELAKRIDEHTHDAVPA